MSTTRRTAVVPARIFACGFMIVLVACGGSSTPPSPTPNPTPGPSPAVCSYSVSPTSISLSANGGTATVVVTASTGCPWSVTSSANWIATTGGSGTGNGQFSVTVGANAGSSRTGTFTVADKTVIVTQNAAAPTCSYSVSPLSLSLAASVGTGTVSVQTTSSCSWTAASNASWITITAGSGGTGNGQANFSVQTNTTTGSRTGMLTVAQQTVTVTQAAGASGPAPAQPQIQGNYTFEVKAASRCGWPVQTHGWPLTVRFISQDRDGYSSGVSWEPTDVSFSSTLVTSFAYSYSPGIFGPNGGVAGSIDMTNGNQGMPSPYPGRTNYWVWMEQLTFSGGAPTRGADGRPEIIDARLSGGRFILTAVSASSGLLCTGSDVGTMSLRVR